MIDTMLHSLDLIHESVVIVEGHHYMPNTAANQPRYTGITLPQGNRSYSLLVEEEECLGCDRMDCICDSDDDINDCDCGE
jgi:hypothetical protein